MVLDTFLQVLDYVLDVDDVLTKHGIVCEGTVMGQFMAVIRPARGRLVARSWLVPQRSQGHRQRALQPAREPGLREGPHDAKRYLLSRVRRFHPKRRLSRHQRGRCLGRQVPEC